MWMAHCTKPPTLIRVRESKFDFSDSLVAVYCIEQYTCRVRKARDVEHLSKSCDDIFRKLIQTGVPPEQLYDTVCKQVFCTRCATF
jgi:hypothetical protein